MVGVDQLLWNFWIFPQRGHQMSHGSGELLEVRLSPEVKYQGGVGGDGALHEVDPVHLGVGLPGRDAGQLNEHLELLEVLHVLLDPPDEVHAELHGLQSLDILLVPLAENGSTVEVLLGDLGDGHVNVLKILDLEDFLNDRKRCLNPQELGNAAESLG